MRFGEWKIWNGGECPVDPDTKVQAQMAEESRCYSEGKGVRKAVYFSWKHMGTSKDIVAYREVIEPKVGTVDNVFSVNCNYDNKLVKITFKTKDGKIDTSVDPVAEWLDK